MKQVTLNIPDNKYQFFMELVKSLKFVKVDDSTIPQGQQDEVARRIDMVEEGEMKTRSWEEAKNDIFKDK